MTRTAMFTGLVFDEAGSPAQVAWVGENACYVVDDDGFLRHIDAGHVDRQVLRFLLDQVEGNRDMAVSAMLGLDGGTTSSHQNNGRILHRPHGKSSRPAYPGKRRCAGSACWAFAS